MKYLAYLRSPSINNLKVSQDEVLRIRYVLWVHWLFQVVRVVLFSETRILWPNLKISKGWNLYYVILKKLMNTSSFIKHIKQIRACSTVFVEYMICFGELEENSLSFSSFESASLNPHASLCTKKLTRTELALRVSSTKFHSVKKSSITFTNSPHALLGHPH